MTIANDSMDNDSFRTFLYLFYATAISASIVVFASMADNPAQISVAAAAMASDKHAIICVPETPTLHPRTLDAQRMGAEIVSVPYTHAPHVYSRAKSIASHRHALCLPMSLELPTALPIYASLARSMRAHDTYDEVWSVAMTGQLIRGLALGNLGASYHAIALTRAPMVGTARLLRAPDPARRIQLPPPPFPSALGYHAIAWSFVRACARHGRILLWNGHA